MEKGDPNVDGCGAGAEAGAGAGCAGCGAGAGAGLAGCGAAAGAGVVVVLGAASRMRELMTLRSSCGEVDSKYLPTAAFCRAALTSAGDASGRYCNHESSTHTWHCLKRGVASKSLASVEVAEGMVASPPDTVTVTALNENRSQRC